MGRRATVLAAFAACGCADPDATDAGGSDGDGASWGDAGVAPDALVDGPRPRRCVAPPGTGAPGTIEAAVRLLNALPPPVDIACFVESLERPLSIHASASTFSAQPALGPSDPRVFIFSGELVMSVVSAGDGVRLLEFGEFVDDTHTIKAEVELPHEGLIEPWAPFDRIRFQNGTGCGLCHHQEQAVPAGRYVNAFSSLALRPTIAHDLAVDDVLAAYARCDYAETPERCAILTAVFGHGDVQHREFPDHLPTFGE